MYKHQKFGSIRAAEIVRCTTVCAEKNHVCEINIFPWSVKRGAKQNVISKAHSIVTQYIRLGIVRKN